MDDSAILIAADGLVSAPPLADLADFGYRAGRYAHVLELLGFAGPFEVTFMDVQGLVVWADHRAIARKQGLNLRASISIVKAFGAPLPTIYGPAIVTGGCSCSPRALTDHQLLEALDLLDLDVDDEALWS